MRGKFLQEIERQIWETMTPNERMAVEKIAPSDISGDRIIHREGGFFIVDRILYAKGVKNERLFTFWFIFWGKFYEKGEKNGFYHFADETDASGFAMWTVNEATGNIDWNNLIDSEVLI